MKSVFKIALGLVVVGAVLPSAAARAGVTDDAGDAQRLVSLIDYVGGDYGRAVRDGAIDSQDEYQEQQRFLADAIAIARRLLPSDAEPLHARLRSLESLVAHVADADTVRRASHEARDEAVQRFGLRTTPNERPSLADAEVLYSQGCAVCHGARGDADTERARALDPAPASFRDESRLAQLSPYRVYNAMTFGVSGTSMASFEAYTPAERWSLAFYVFRLGHAGQPAKGPVAMTLADMAGRTDAEILDLLRAEGHPDPPAALAHLRRDAAFLEPPAGVGIDRTRRLVRDAVAAFKAGRALDADRLVLDAYLQGFEPLEVRLRGRDPAGTQAVETAFGDLRGALVKGDAAGVEREGSRVESLLARIAEGERPMVPFAAAALIFFREGIEAALLVGALLAGVRRLGRGDAARYIHMGWIAALPAGLLTWWALERLVALGAQQRELMEAGVSLFAAAVLFSVSFWMISKAESRHWIAYLRRNLERSLNGQNLTVLAVLAFLAVYREAAETVLFTEALLLDAPGQRAQVLGGAGLGLLGVLAAAWVLNRTVGRLPLGPFFAVSSLLLCVLAIAFAGSGIHVLVASGHLAPRPVAFPEVPWMGIHPDLTSLLVQLAIVAAVAVAGLLALWRGPAQPTRGHS
jgi:high-affinity iron transporter